MKKNLLGIAVLLLSLSLTASLAPSATHLAGLENRLAEEVPCSRPKTLSSSGTITTGQGTSCYRISVGSGTSFVRLEFEPLSGTYDLYYAQELASKLDTKINRTRVNKKVFYAWPHPQAGSHTLVVDANASSSRFRIRAEVVKSTTGFSSQPGSACGEGCRDMFPSIAQSVSVPFEIYGPGWIYARVNWSGTAQSISMSLSSLEITASTNGRNIGNNTIELNYQISPATFARSQHWQLTLNYNQFVQVTSLEVTWPGLHRHTTREVNIDRMGEDYDHRSLPRPDPELCRSMCSGDLRCAAYTYQPPARSGDPAICHLKDAVPRPSTKNGLVSGVIYVRELSREENTDRPGMDYRSFLLNQPEPDLCKAACANDAQCAAYTYVHPGVNGTKAVCYLKSGVPAQKSGSCCISGTSTFRTTTREYNTDRMGMDYRSFTLDEPAMVEQCANSCAQDPLCAAYTYVRPSANGAKAMCYLKSGVPSKTTDNRCISGIVQQRSLNMEPNSDRPQWDYFSYALSASNPETCRIECALDLKCKAYAYKEAGYQGPNPICYLKNSVPKLEPNACCLTGVVSIR